MVQTKKKLKTLVVAAARMPAPALVLELVLALEPGLALASTQAVGVAP